jgi:hypothetical protein
LLRIEALAHPGDKIAVARAFYINNVYTLSEKLAFFIRVCDFDWCAAVL